MFMAGYSATFPLFHFFQYNKHSEFLTQVFMLPFIKGTEINLVNCIWFSRHFSCLHYYKEQNKIFLVLMAPPTVHWFWGVGKQDIPKHIHNLQNYFPLPSWHYGFVLLPLLQQSVVPSTFSLAQPVFPHFISFTHINSSVKDEKAREIEERGPHVKIGSVLVLKPIFLIMLGGWGLICPEVVIFDKNCDGCRHQCHQIRCIFMVRLDDPAKYHFEAAFGCIWMSDASEVFMLSTVPMDYQKILVLCW